MRFMGINYTVCGSSVKVSLREFGRKGYMEFDTEEDAKDWIYNVLNGYENVEEEV